MVAVAALTVGLFWAYLLQSRTQSVNSDAVAQVLQGWEMLHGNLLLRGWALSDVSFYTFEVPVDGLISLIYGFRGDVVHVAAAIEYALLVLLAALVAAGSGRDRRHGAREAWVRGLVAAGIMCAPGEYPGAHILLLAPDHIGIGVPVLATFLVLDRVRPRRWPAAVAMVLLVCLMLTWAQLDDPVAEFAGALPLAVACAAPLAAFPIRRLAGRIRRWIRRRRGRPDNPPLSFRRDLTRLSYNAAVVVAAGASYVLTKQLVRAIGNAGGFYLHAIPNGKPQFTNMSLLGAQVRALGLNVMYLFGANFWDRWQPLTFFGYLHLAGVALALLGLLLAIGTWARADPVTRTLVLATLAVLAAGAVSPLMTAISGAHEIAIIVPLGAALAGRRLGPWLAGRRPRAQETPERLETQERSEDGESLGDRESREAPDTQEVREVPDSPEALEDLGALEAREDQKDQAAPERKQPAKSGRGRRARLGTATRIAAACVLIAVGGGYLAGLGYNASQPPGPEINQTLAAWLEANNLTSGLGGYWDSNITFLQSGGKVRIAPITDGASYGYLWEAKPAWYNPDISQANFVIATTQQKGAGYVYYLDAINWYGEPITIYTFGTTMILIYDYNLLGSTIQPELSQLNSPG